MLPQLHDAAGPYVILRLYRLLQPLGRILENVSTAAATLNDHALPMVPYMPDFIRFLDYDRKTLLRKKRWP